MTVAADLTDALHQHYRSLPPDGLYPAPGGAADGYIRMLAGLLTLEVEAATRLVLDWLPETANEDALALIGAARSLRRWPREPLETWRRRVIGAADFWALAGTYPGMTLALAQAGYQAAIVEHGRDDGDLERWAEFSVALTPLAPIVTPWQWGDGQWGQQPGQPRRRWGGLDPNGIPLQYLKDLIREVKPAHARLRRLTYRNRARYWGSPAKWGEGRTGGRPGVPAGWGVSYGLPFVIAPGTSADNGPTWGGESELVLYDIDAS